MSNQKKQKNWWERQSTEVKVAIIALLGTVITTIIAPIVVSRFTNDPTSTPFPETMTPISTMTSTESVNPASTQSHLPGVTPSVEVGEPTATVFRTPTVAEATKENDCDLIEQSEDLTEQPVAGVFSFEGDETNWLAPIPDSTVSISSSLAHCGTQSLELNAVLDGRRQDRIYAEALALFTNNTPEGMTTSNIQNLEATFVSCHVFLPTGFVQSQDTMELQLFIEDINGNRLVNTTEVNIGNLDQWLKLELEVTQGQQEIDAERVHALGVRAHTDPEQGRAISYIGSIYIDDCIIQKIPTT